MIWRFIKKNPNKLWQTKKDFASYMPMCYDSWGYDNERWSQAEEYVRIHEIIIRRANHEVERDIKVEKIMMARD